MPSPYRKLAAFLIESCGVPGKRAWGSDASLSFARLNGSAVVHRFQVHGTLVEPCPWHCQ